VNHDLAEATILPPSPLQTISPQKFSRHLEEKIEELIAGGMSRKEASYAARREFGERNFKRRHDSREVWLWPSDRRLFHGMLATVCACAKVARGFAGGLRF